MGPLPAAVQSQHEAAYGVVCVVQGLLRLVGNGAQTAVFGSQKRRAILENLRISLKMKEIII